MPNIVDPVTLVELVDEYEGMDKLEIKDKNVVDLCAKSGFPKDIEVKDCFLLRMIESNCKGVDNVRVGADLIHCSRMEKAPKVFELISRCKELWFNWADVSDCEFKLEKGGDKLCMTGAKGIKVGSDFSGFDYVDMSAVNMRYFDSYKFKDGSSASFALCSGFSGRVDLSAFDEVDLRGVNFCNVDEIILREGAKINISRAKNLTKVLDISKCRDVRADLTDLTGVERIVYKDNEQANKFISEVDYSTYPVTRIDGRTPPRNLGGGGMDR